MPATLTTGLSDSYPINWAQGPDWAIYGFNGIDPPVRWDGLATATTGVGIGAASNATLAQGAAGTLGAGVYIGYVQYVDANGVGGNLSSGTSVTIAASKKIAWSGIPVSSDTRVTGRRLWRTTAGEAGVAYLVTTLNASDTTYTDDFADTVLDNNTSIVLANADGSIPAEAQSRTQPPGHLSAVVQHRSRMYGAVPVIITDGHAEVTNGSTSVVGVNTHFTSAMIGRTFSIKGDTVQYTISAVGSTTSLTLSTSYAGTTNYLAEYTIQPDNDELLNVYYTFVDSFAEPESWPATFSFQPQADGGAITGLLTLDSYLYLLKQASVWRFSVEADPATDGGVFLATGSRGCENQRCWVRVDGDAFLLDRQGIYKFSGSSADPISLPIQDLFRNGAINWAASKWFSAAYDQESQNLMFFVALGANYLPRHCLCYSVRFGCWAIYEFPTGIGAQALIRFGNRRRLALGGEHSRIFLTAEGTLDGIAPSTGGTLRGTVSSATALTLTDSTASFPSSLSDVPLVIVAGKGKNQINRIVSVSGQTLTLKYPFLTSLDSTSVYQIGGIEWKWRSGLMRLTQRNSDTTRQVEVTYEPTDTTNQFDIGLRLNHQKQNLSYGLDKEVGTVYSENGVTTIAGGQAVEVNMSRNRDVNGEIEGLSRFQFDGNTLVKGAANRFLGVQLNGFSCSSNVAFYQVEIDGVRV